ncbi:Pantothenate kinase type III, CoaX-like [Euzebya pacifica]|uniref:Type III pantothenate kinase n=1 Tax=Euzebya pacifica TaxID=1608957 RepID=A0A346Y2R9_9ACTN|nr:type III pantothenate kinase [Euzebya pacifica]AXV08766.1 Pantothenate kinase type III, CoaX-like [Euzebya pacifica]
MLLAVDVGNSNTVIGVYEGTELVEHWRIATDSRRTADELALLFQGFMAFQNLSFSRNVHGVVLSSVVPLMTERLVEMTRKYFHFAPVVVRPGTKTGFAINMDNPREVGADRLVNAIAAHDQFGGPGIVVDFGTSTNFDVYTADGTFIGGVIAPGVMLSMEALSSRGAQLPKFELRRPRSAIGRNTVEAMQSGAVYGFAGQVDRIVEKLTEALEEEPVVIATGGLASAIVEECHTISHHEPWLTLSGLRIIWDRNT